MIRVEANTTPAPEGPGVVYKCQEKQLTSSTGIENPVKAPETDPGAAYSQGMLHAPEDVFRTKGA